MWCCTQRFFCAVAALLCLFRQRTLCVYSCQGSFCWPRRWPSRGESSWKSINAHCARGKHHNSPVSDQSEQHNLDFLRWDFRTKERKIASRNVPTILQPLGKPHRLSPSAVGSVQAFSLGTPLPHGGRFELHTALPQWGSAHDMSPRPASNKWLASQNAAPLHRMQFASASAPAVDAQSMAAAHCTCWRRTFGLSVSQWTGFGIL